MNFKLSVFAFALVIASTQAVAQTEEETSSPVFFKVDDATREDFERTTVAKVKSGYIVRNSRCVDIGDTQAGCFGVQTSPTITCLGLPFAYVPALGGYVWTQALTIGACSGG